MQYLKDILKRVMQPLYTGLWNGLKAILIKLNRFAVSLASINKCKLCEIRERNHLEVVSNYRARIDILLEDVKYYREQLEYKERLMNRFLGLEITETTKSNVDYSKPLHRITSPARTIAKLEADSRIQARKEKK